MSKGKKSLGRDGFSQPQGKNDSGALEKLIRGKPLGRAAGAKAVEVRVKLTPSNIKYLDKLRSELVRRGKGDYSRSDLIRIAISLLSIEDF